MKTLLGGSIIFLLWSAFSVQWYVCKTKGFCDASEFEANTLSSFQRKPTLKGIDSLTDHQAKKKEELPWKSVDHPLARLASKMQEARPKVESVKVKEEALEKEALVGVAKVYFSYGSDQPKLNQTVLGQLNRIANSTLRHGHRVVVTGYTDTISGSTFNQKLGMRRALSIKKILEKEGVPGSLIEINSQGEATDPNKGLKESRRVEVKIVA